MEATIADGLDAPAGGCIANHKTWLVGVIVACATFAVYLATLAPNLTFRHWGTDGGDLVTAAWTLGIPHPPGYPTYTLMAWVATHLPIGSIAYRVNLLSAICAACGAAFVCMSVQAALSCRETSWVPAAVPALTLAFAPLVWSQAILAEVYAPAFLFASVSLFLALRWRSGGPRALLWLSALVLGLGLGVHLTLAFTIPCILVMLWPQRQRWQSREVLLPSLALFSAGLGIFAYLPLAASRQPILNWGDPDSWDRFFWMVTGRLYGSMALGLPVKDIVPRASDWARLVAEQLGWLGWPLAFLGLARLCRRDRTLGIASILWLGVATLFAFLYNSDDSLVYLVPALIAPGIWLGVGAEALGEWAKHLTPRTGLVLVALFLLPASSLLQHWHQLDLAGDRSVDTYVNAALDAIAPGGLALAQGDRPTFALWYATGVQRTRQDIAVVNTTLLGFDWYRAQLRRRYPHLVVPEPAAQSSGADELVRELVIRNYLSRPVYAMDPSDEWQAWFEIAREGSTSVYRVLVRSRWEQAQ